MEDEIFCSSYVFENTITGTGTRVPYRVAECTEYQPFNQQSMKKMEEIAWLIQPRKKGPSGFSDPAKPEEKEEDSSPIELEIVPPPPRKSRFSFNDDE